MSKYDALRGFLRQRHPADVALSLRQIAEIVPGGLPQSAYQYREWWSNETNGSHVQARSWQGAGYVVAAVNLTAGTVSFETSTAACR
jgi:hypothetical protein